ncbi:MAG: cupin domain-containing protein [Chitinophagales bacterium]|jgi:quercetin dioxygenase-like cupin family protein|nr:cupin domain-containing protein [Bacteroidota bacterium]MBK7568270.1 cupin domain-containing protein [Bacteroidota bacterium]MBP8916060.1 cupin domain-containing protein [Chitinophagales bacterium]MBP9220541.1 cupin domain-containing protein [Chitinophagales bacterium]MBP9795932.1 cupin domain-containing protein [Chitinophagales bacterium]
MENFVDTALLTSREVAPGFFGKFIHSEKMSIVYWEAIEGAEIPLHSHIHEMMVNVIEGKLELNIDGNIRLLEYGTVAFIPGNVPHKAKALTNCKIIDVFYPVREDYK